MSDKTVYIDACPLIDLAKYKAKLHGANVALTEEREKDVWYVKKLLELARSQGIKVITSTVTIAECTHTQENQPPVPMPEIKRFYSELLTSGKSGIFLVQPLQSILVRARKLSWEDGVYLKPIDSIHVASALHHGCSEIWTRDTRILNSFPDRLATFGLKCTAPSDSGVITDPYKKEHDPNQTMLDFPRALEL